MPPPRKPYVIAGKVQYRGVDISGAKVWITNETVAGSRSFVSSEADSNFAYNLANVSAWTNSNVILIAVTHNGRRGQKRVTVNSANFGENVGTISLKAHWGCMG
jgi:hypothetical protein